MSKYLPTSEHIVMYAMHAALMRVQFALAVLQDAKAHAKAAKSKAKVEQAKVLYRRKTRLRQCKRCGIVEQCRPNMNPPVTWFANDPNSWLCAGVCYPAELAWQLWDVFVLPDAPVGRKVGYAKMLQKVMANEWLSWQVCSYL